MCDTAVNNFVRELSLMRDDTFTTTHAYFTYKAIHIFGAESRDNYHVLNRHRIFWNIVLYALQNTFFTCLARIFDQNSPHGIDTLIRTAQEKSDIFSAEALAGRRRKDFKSEAELKAYVEKAYIPTAADFRVLRKEVAAKRKIFEEKYRDIRHKVFTHKEVVEDDERKALFAKTNIGEFEELLEFFFNLEAALQGLLDNGHDPSLQRPRSSFFQEVKEEAEDDLRTILQTDKKRTT